MAELYTAKTLKGIAEVEKRLLDTMGTLEDIDPIPEDERALGPLRRARALTPKLLDLVAELSTECHRIARERRVKAPEDPQQELPMDPTESDLEAAETAGRDAYASGDPRDACHFEAGTPEEQYWLHGWEQAAAEAEEIETENAEDSEAEDPEATEVRANVEAWAKNRDVEMLVARLKAVGRSIHPAVIFGWDKEERQSALAWAAAALDGTLVNPAAHQPDHVAGPHLEDLNLQTREGWDVLLASIGVDSRGITLESDQWEELIGWAEALHRHRRREEVEIPEPPGVVLPDNMLFQKIKNDLADHEGGLSFDDLVARHAPEDLGARFAVEALIRAREIAVSDDGACYAGTGKLSTDDAELRALAAKIARWM